MEEKILIITDVDEIGRYFKCRHEPENTIYQKLQELLNYCQATESIQDDWYHWRFLEKEDENSFIEAVGEWFVIE